MASLLGSALRKTGAEKVSFRMGSARVSLVRTRSGDVVFRHVYTGDGWRSVEEWTLPHCAETERIWSDAQLGILPGGTVEKPRQ